MAAKTKYLKDNINIIVEKLREDSIDNAYYFVQVLDYMREMLHSLTHLNQPALDHVDNTHKPLSNERIDELSKLHGLLSSMIDLIVSNMQSGDFSNQDELQIIQKEMIDDIERFNKGLIKRLKQGETGTKNSILYLNLLNETKNLTLQAGNLYKSQRDFVDYNKDN